MENLIIPRPEQGEYASYYGKYVSLVESEDILFLLRKNKTETQNLLAEISDKKAHFRYAEGKWSIKELLGHIIDSERIFAYRALCFARNDKTPIEGFEQDDYIANADFDNCKLADLIAEFACVRDSTVLMFQNLNPQALQRSGIASANEISVRAIAYIIAGHEIHHINILKERYLD